jgi:UMF1 family MFS transporter
MAPFLGAVADRGSAKKKLLATFAFFGIMMTSGLWLVQQGFWKYAILFYVSATVGWSGANIFYDSLLPDVASRKEVDFVSSLGYALGYIGGGILFLLNVVIFLQYDSFGIPNVATAIKINFLSVAIWWAIFSIPIFLYVNEPKLDTPVSFTEAIPSGWKQLMHTLRDLKHFKIVTTFLLAYWLYIDGVDTIVRMAVDYGKSLKFTDNTLITALLMVQFIAFPAALAYSWIASKIGTKTAVLTGIAGYIVITFFGFFMFKEWHFYFLAGLVGLFQGGIQALSRSLYTCIIPHNKSAEFFGFYNMLGKFAAVIGPFMMGAVTIISGSARIGILSILVLFISGGILLWRVDIKQGEKIARDYLSD